jgi:hypothetical protein
MAQLVLDVVVLLPVEQRSWALDISARLDKDMRSQACASHFRLGEPYTGRDGGPCEPHVSLFMLAVDEDEVVDVLRATEKASWGCPTIHAEGHSYRHNPHGAPELYFHKTREWIELQRDVITAVEPLRRGRLRDVDPAGARILDLMTDPAQDAARRRQLDSFGYDEVTMTWDPAGTDENDRFNPHVTLAWPVDPACQVDLGDLPHPSAFSGALTELAVYGMSPYGTCTTWFGTVHLGGAQVAQATAGSASPGYQQ